MTINPGYEPAEAWTDALRVPRVTCDAGLRMGKMRFGYEGAYGDGISRDPIGEQGGLNLYGYVLNNPISLIDPLGLESYVVFSTDGFNGYGHAGLISKDPQTGLYTRFDHAWGTVSQTSSYDVNSLLKEPGTDIATVIPDENGSDQRIDDARRAFKPHSSTSTYSNNCISSVQDILGNAGVDIPHPFPRYPNAVLSDLLANPNVLRRIITPRGQAFANGIQ